MQLRRLGRLARFHEGPEASPCRVDIPHVEQSFRKVAGRAGDEEGRTLRRVAIAITVLLQQVNRDARVEHEARGARIEAKIGRDYVGRCGAKSREGFEKAQIGGGEQYG